MSRGDWLLGKLVIGHWGSGVVLCGVGILPVRVKVDGVLGQDAQTAGM